MKKLFRRIGRLLVVLVVVIALGGIAAGLLADNAARVAVEKASTKALDVPVNVRRAHLSILGGTLRLHDLTVANPPGYRQEMMLNLDRGDIQVDARSLLGDTISVKDIKLDGMKVALEQKGLDNNLREVLASLRRDRDPSGKKVQVDNLEITNIEVTVRLLPILGQPDTLRFAIAPIKLTNLGRDEPMDIATLTTTVLLAVATGISEQGSDVLPNGMLKDLTGVLNKALDIGRIIFGGSQNTQGGDGRSGRGISEGLRGLLGTRNSDEPQ